jgi:magnesium chelatase subunit H
MRKPTSAVNRTPIRVVLVTMDSHLGGAFARATDTLRRELPNLELVMHAADEWGCTPRSCGRACRNGAAHTAEKWGCNPEALKACLDDIARADIVIAAMLFLDEHVQAVLPALQARRDNCDAIVGCLSAGEIVRLTRLGRFDMSKEAGGALAWLKRLRGKSDEGTNGKGQMKSLRQLPKLLKFIPGTAQDVRAYFLTLQYWLQQTAG